MGQEVCYENYPFGIIMISHIMQFSIYIIGGYIIYQLGILWLVLYLLYVLVLMIRLMRRSCRNCYYYGRFCFSGFGKLCSLFFKKGDPKEFHKDDITWKDIIPDMMIAIIPIITGIILMIIDFDWTILILVLILALLGSVGSGMVRSSLACKHCKQREIGCPAEQLFNKKK